MSLLRHGLYWRDHLRWYERASLVVWWLGLFVFLASLSVATALAYISRFDRAGIQGALAVALVGLSVLLATRLLLFIAIRRRRRKSVHGY
ncbi:hypothetical protein [Reyranella sp. CPCC 100927]|uniref:hypothetical protein n=1 Tax=Reyranella sp. CPCC 100927 TaxID=2599616 RepID=UPI0011B72719|nr:hypothetical protein [Reyranella sp. CPCC 100927]TWS94693.1 hypothetical protein FQU96_40935 [Reyranella sp. CPCC 100927]